MVWYVSMGKFAIVCGLCGLFSLNAIVSLRCVAPSDKISRMSLKCGSADLLKPP